MTCTDHPSTGSLIRCVANSGTDDPTRRFFLHHLEACAPCRDRVLQDLGLDPHDLAQLLADPARLLALWRSRQPALPAERLRRLPWPPLRDSLARHPLSYPLTTARNLLALSRQEAAEGNSTLALSRAQAAAALVDAHLGSFGRTASAVALAAEAWVWVSCLERRRGDLAASSRAIATAQRWTKSTSRQQARDGGDLRDLPPAVVGPEPVEEPVP